MDSGFFCVLVLASIFVMASTYYQPCQNQNLHYQQYTPYTTPCRDSVEDIKALMDLSNALKEDSCDNCNRMFSEEVITKLIDALVTAATQNCFMNQTCSKNNADNDDYLTMDGLESALVRLGVLGGKNDGKNDDDHGKNDDDDDDDDDGKIGENNVDIDIRNTDVIGVTVGDKEVKED